MKLKYTCSKEYTNLPAAHRQHTHDGHCALIHGHNWSFKITFATTILDSNGFVVDFGKLKFVKEWLEEKFDHTLLLNKNDPWLPHLQTVLGKASTNAGSCPALAKIVVVENCGAEYLARYVLEGVTELLRSQYYGKKLEYPVWVDRVVVLEDSKNSATCWKVQE